jgi:hypothetical protein
MIPGQSTLLRELGQRAVGSPQESVSDSHQLRSWMPKRPRIFGILLCSGLLVAALAALAIPPVRAAVLRQLLFGGALIEVATPRPAQVLGQGGIPVLIQFPRVERTAASSLRCLLNGVDVTERLTLGENGAAGSLWARRDGPQTLRVEVFGQSWWLGTYFEDAIELSFEVRPNPSLDRAGRARGRGPRA